jgi:hypothetical protein
MGHEKRVRRLIALAVITLLGAAVFTLGVMIKAGEGWNQGFAWWLGFFAFGAWAVSPYAAMAVMSLAMKRTLPQSLVFLLGCLLVTGFGGVVLIDGFYIHHDAQNALLFVFLPIYQWIGVAATFVIGLWVAKRQLGS